MLVCLCNILAVKLMSDVFFSFIILLRLTRVQGCDLVYL